MVVVIGILAAFAVVTIANMQPGNLAPSTYPGVRAIVSSVALTFFAFLGFGVVTFTAKDLARPSKKLPRAMFLAIGLATIIYVAVSIGVFGTLSVDRGHRRGTNGDRIGGAAGARRPGLLADYGDRAVRDGRRDKRRPLPGDRPVRPPCLDGPIPDGDGSDELAAGRRSD